MIWSRTGQGPDESDFLVFFSMTVTSAQRNKMRLVAKSGSLDQLQTFLESNPETLNEYVSGSPPRVENPPQKRSFSCFFVLTQMLFHDHRMYVFPFFSPPHTPMMVTPCHQMLTSMPHPIVCEYNTCHPLSIHT